MQNWLLHRIALGYSLSFLTRIDFDAGLVYGYLTVHQLLFKWEEMQWEKQHMDIGSMKIVMASELIASKDQFPGMKLLNVGSSIFVEMSD